MDKDIQFYSLPTPNGQKIGIALEEMGLPYTPHRIDITKGDQFSEEFVKINPNSKIPAIVDPIGPDGKPLAVFESAAILIYLSEKSGLFLPTDPRLRMETLQWLIFQVANVGPMFGQFGHFFKHAKAKCDHPYPVERYRSETRRLLAVLEKQLQGRTFLVGEEYTIADMATVPWVNGIDIFYGGTEVLGLNDFVNVKAWVERVLVRPKTIIGMSVCKK